MFGKNFVHIKIDFSPSKKLDTVEEKNLLNKTKEALECLLSFNNAYIMFSQVHSSFGRSGLHSMRSGSSP